MSTITLPNIRVSSDLEIRLKLKDGGVAIDWTTLSNIKATIYSDRQRSLAGRCDIAIDEDDATVLVCRYSANKPQYPGVNRVIVSCTYDGETKTYDKPALNFVRWTDDQAGQEITISDPDIDVEITVEDVSSSILQEAVEAAFSAAERAEEAAAAAEHMVDIHQGPAGPAGADGYDGKSAYEIAVDEGFVGTEAEWLESLVGPQGPQGIQGIQGIQGEQGPQGEQGNTGSSVDYPFELVNNEETNDATKAHTAAGAKRLNDKIGQLDLEVHNLSGKYYGVFPTAEDLPEGTNNGYAYVGANEPFAIYNFIDGEWEDSGSEAIGIQGAQGNSGFQGDFTDLEIVNNLEDGGASAALSAEMGKLLARNMKLLYDSMGAAAFWGEKPVIDWSGNSVPVSLTLTDCTIDNLASTVPLGDSYEATITPDVGNILGTVVCTMNGEQQTVTNGHIYIEEVTGSIVISAEGINLDSVAYESLSYRQLFETNNFLGINPGFENGSYSPMTASTGSPSITDEDADSGDYSLKVVNSGTSNQIRCEPNTKKGCYIACRAKVVNWSAGAVGMRVGIVDYQTGFSENTDWATAVFHKPAIATAYSVFVGSFQYPESTGYVDTPVCILDDVFTNVPSLDVFTQLYENYVAIKKAA